MISKSESYMDLVMSYRIFFMILQFVNNYVLLFNTSNIC